MNNRRMERTSICSSFLRRYTWNCPNFWRGVYFYENRLYGVYEREI